MRKYWPHHLLVLVLILTIACYWRGLNGPFLFDDAPNLDAMGGLGGVTDWVTLKAYVMTGWSGPTGRPLSLLSFLINDNTWPSAPLGFKITNLELHLICGLLLAWANYLLLKSIGRSETDAAGIAVLAAAIWMLHPFMLSTTLYVVQRMTILAALFTLAGTVGYLKGRLWLRDKSRSAAHAYLLMTGSVALGTLLAVLSKENGALLPLLLLVVEIFLRRMGSAEPCKWWISLVLGLPSMAVIAYLVRLFDFSANPWPNRPFNQIERLYSESRIIWDYILQLWVPRIEGAGLYRDGFEISRSITQPISTIWSLLGLMGLFAFSPYLYRKWPFVWLALAYFMCGHLVESTVVALELYFEHRNYAPALFMFLPLTIGIDWLGKKHGYRLSIIAGAGVIFMLAWLTWQRAELWSDNNRLQTYWALKAPESARGRNYLISRLVDEKKYGQAVAMADQAILELPSSSLLTMSWLRIHVNTYEATQHHFDEAARKLIGQPFDAQAVAGLRVLVDDVIGAGSRAQYRQFTLGLIQELAARGPYREFPLFLRIVAYNQARLYLALDDVPMAYRNYRLAMERYRQASAAMQMFAEMAESGNVKEAAQMLDAIEHGIASGTYDVRPLGAAYYIAEIVRLRKVVAGSQHNESVKK